MSKDAYSTEMELYGVSPSVIAIIMFIITVLAPLGYIPNYIIAFPIFWLEPMIYSSLWVILLNPMYNGFPIRILWPPDALSLLSLIVLNWLFALWIVRYYQSKSTRYTAVMIGLLSNLLPLALSIYISGMMGAFRVVYPIPLQFILGLIILWRIEGPEVISPWSGMRLDLSWWKWRSAKRKNDWDPFEKERQIVSQKATSDGE